MTRPTSRNGERTITSRQLREAAGISKRQLGEWLKAGVLPDRRALFELGREWHAGSGFPLWFLPEDVEKAKAVAATMRSAARLIKGVGLKQCNVRDWLPEAEL